MRRRESVEKQGRCETLCLMLQCGVLKCLSHFTFIFNKPLAVSTLHVEWTPQPYMYWSICVNVLWCIFKRDWWNTSGWLCSSFPEVSLSDTLLKHILHPPIFWQNTVCFASSEVLTSRVVKCSYIQTDSCCVALMLLVEAMLLCLPGQDLLMTLSCLNLMVLAGFFHIFRWNTNDDEKNFLNIK